MSIIDEQGRVFGRFNLVDAAAALLIIVMVPVSYGAYLLVRDPPPQLTDVAPNVYNQAPGLQVEVHGRSLRPYMRVSFGEYQGRGFYFGGPTQAIVQLPDLVPGKYNVILYDYAQEVSRLKEALTIVAPPQPPQVTVTVNGTFTNLTDAQAAKLGPNFKLPETGTPMATVLQVGRPEPSTAGIRAGDMTLRIPQPDQRELPATVTLSCFLTLGPDGIPHCAVGGILLGPDANIRLLGLGTSLNFRVSDVHIPGESNAAVVRVHFTPHAGVHEHVAVGDRDIGGRAFPSGVMARIESLSGNAAGVDAVLRVELAPAATGWMYKGHPVKIGAALTFETDQYTMDGLITGVEVAGAGK